MLSVETLGHLCCAGVVRLPSPARFRDRGRAEKSY